MSRLSSPLRYPGGKSCLYGIAVQLIRKNNLYQRAYVEPYSGGCGLALNLLFGGHVSHIHLNDLDRSIWSFWKAALDHTDDFLKLVAATDITVDEWQRQREVQLRKVDADPLELGFSTFFLNRTNRSGIIHSGGIIGGKSQSGSWKIDCRFNKADLTDRIRRVSLYRNRISLYNEDAEQLIQKLEAEISKNCLMYIDPPYYVKGSQLYKNSYRPADHQRIASLISQVKSPWFMTYDNVEQIKNLYSEYSSTELDIGYSVEIKRRGSEIFIVSEGLKIPVDGHVVAH